MVISRWTALSTAYRTSLSDGWSPMLSNHRVKEVLAEAVSTWAWLSQCSFLLQMLPCHLWSEAQCRNQNHSWSSLWQLMAVGWQSSPKNSEKEKGRSGEIKLKPSHEAQQLWKALMRNPAKAGTSLHYQRCLIKAWVNSVCPKPDSAMRSASAWLCLVNGVQRSTGSSACPLFPELPLNSLRSAFLPPSLGLVRPGSMAFSQEKL